MFSWICDYIIIIILFSPIFPKSFCKFFHFGSRVLACPMHFGACNQRTFGVVEGRVRERKGMMYFSRLYKIENKKKKDRLLVTISRGQLQADCQRS